MYIYIFLITFVVKTKTKKKNRFPILGGNIYNSRSALCEISPAGPEQSAFHAYNTTMQIL